MRRVRSVWRRRRAGGGGGWAVAAVLLLGMAAVPGAVRAQGGTGSAGVEWSPQTPLRWRSVRDADVIRGVWITRWEYRSPDDVRALMAEAADLGMTDVFFQVRGRGDAFYRSSLEPWGSELTGQLGRDPGWDPLAAAVTEAHSRGMRLHAWVNTFPMWSGSSPPPPSQPEHIYNRHPEWIMVNREGLTQRLGNRFGYVSASPGHPGVHDHLTAVVTEIVRGYPVDGVHFDYIRLPDADYSYDAESRGRYLRESTVETYMQWQADRITALLRRIADEAREIRPALILTAAVVNHYHRAVSIFAQDPAAWTEPGILDYVIPMAYTNDPSAFDEMVRGYRDRIAGGNLVAGISLDELPNDPMGVAVQVQQSLLAGMRGHVFFSMGSLGRLGQQRGAPGDLYAWLEDVRGHRIAAAERAPRPGGPPRGVPVPPVVAPPLPEPDRATPAGQKPSSPGGSPPETGLRYLLPTIMAGVLVIVLLIR